MKRSLKSGISLILAVVALFSLFIIPKRASAAGTPVPPSIDQFIDFIDVRPSSRLTAGRSIDIYVMVHFNKAVFTNFLGYETSADADKAQLIVSGFSYLGLYSNDVNESLQRPIPQIDADGWAEIKYSVTLSSSFVGTGVTIEAEVRHKDYADPIKKELLLQVETVELPSSEPPEPPSSPRPASISVDSTPITTLRAGRSGSLSFGVVNNGERAANNLSATIMPTDPELYSLLMGVNSQAAFTANLSTVRRNTSANYGNRGTFTYNLILPNTVKAGVYEFEINGIFYRETTNEMDTFSGTIKVVVTNDAEPVSMQITDVGPLFPVHPGELFNLNIEVRNTGGMAAREAVLSVRNQSEDTFMMMGSSAAGLIGTVGAGQSGNRTLTLRVASTTKSENLPLTISLSYLDVDDKQITTVYEAVIEVLLPPDPPESEIEMTRATIPGGILEPGQSSVLTIELRNSGAGLAENVRLRVSGFTGTGMYLTDGEDNLPGKTIESIAPGDRATVAYNVILSEMCTSSALALQAEIRYKMPDGNENIIVENISFPVLLPEPSESPSPEPSPTSVPKLIIDRYEMSWEDVPIQTLRAGAMFDLSFTLRNTSKLTGLSNLTVTLSSIDGVFMPAAGSNTFFIESIPAGEETQRTIRLVVSQSAETKSYQLDFHLDYEDKDGISYRPGETLSLPVIVPLIVEIANFNPPMWGDMGMQTYLMFQYINKGKGTVYNFTIDIEGDFMLPDGSSNYMGNLVSGYTDYFECMMFPMAVGEVTGAVVLRFEDAVGNLTEMREEFTMMVNEPYYPEFPMDDFPGMDSMYPDGGEGGGWFGFAWWIIISCGAGLVVVLTVVTILLVRHSRRKKRRALEDDEDNDVDGDDKE